MAALWIIGYIALSVLTVVLFRYLSPFGERDLGENIDVETGTLVAVFAPVTLVWWAIGWLVRWPISCGGRSKEESM